MRTIILLVGIRLQVQKGRALTPEMVSFFVQHKVILCPSTHSHAADFAKIAKIWQAIGAEVIQMSASRHDEILAYTSHLPHLLAFSLTHQLASHDDNLDIFSLCSGWV